MGWLTDFAGKLFGMIGSGISTVLSWIGSFFSNLFQALFDFLKFLLKPVFIVIALVFYFIYKLGYVLILLFSVLLMVGKVLLSLVGGIFKTLTGFSFTAGSAPTSGSWNNIFSELGSNGLGFFQLDLIAYMLLFIIWFITAFAAIKIISSLRGGGA